MARKTTKKSEPAYVKFNRHIQKKLAKTETPANVEPSISRPQYYLSSEMGYLMSFIKGFIQKAKEWHNGDLHRDTCIAAADTFNLWLGRNGNQQFPLWLSYVVSGYMRDEGIE